MFNYISKKIGLYELFKIIPSLKNQLFKLILLSLLVSFLDLIGLAFVGIFILNLLKNEISIFNNVPLISELNFINQIYFLTFILILVYFVKSLSSYLIFKKIIYYCYDQQNSLRKKYLELFFYNFRTVNGENFEFKISSVVEFIKKITDGYLTYTLKIISDTIILSIVFLFLIINDFFSTLVLIFVCVLSFYFYKLLYKEKISLKGLMSNKLHRSIINKSLFLFNAFREIKIFNKEKEFINDFIICSEQEVEVRKSFLSLLILPRYYAEFIFVMFILLISIVAIISHGNTSLAYSQIGIYGAAAARIAPMMNNMLQSISTMWNSKASVMEISNFFDFRQSLLNEQKGSTDLNILNLNEIDIKKIKIEKMSFSYPSKTIYENVNLELNENNIVGIYGNSGSGKSTLINCIVGFLQPSKGTIKITDQKGAEYESNRHKLIAYIPQDVRLMSENILKNVSLSLDEKNINRDKVIESLKKTNSLEFVNKLEKGLETQLEYDASNLSGGQKQRIAIARALYKNSKILILDEPFSSLDEESENYLIEVLRKIKKGRIIIIITHKKTIAEKFDKILNINTEKKNIDSV